MAKSELLKDVPTVTGNDPKGKKVSITTKKVHPTKDIFAVVVTKEGTDFQSPEYPGYNQNVKKLFDLLCTVEGAPEVAGTFYVNADRSKPVYIVSENDKFKVVNPAAEFVSKNFDSVNDKALRAILHEQVTGKKLATA